MTVKELIEVLEKMPPEWEAKYYVEHAFEFEYPTVGKVCKLSDGVVCIS